jgi:GNAT superfamily N-acetyltransferase
MLRLFAGYSRAEHRIMPNYTLLASGLNISMFNRVMKTNLNPKEADQTISDVKQFFDSKHLPFTWQVDPWDKPHDLAERLEEAGFHRDETPGMAVKIDELVEPAKPEGFRIERVESPDELVAYARLMVKAYGMPEHGWDWFIGGFVNMGLGDDFRHYIGYLDDKPVATSSMFYSDGVAGLYNVATLPETRGKGVGAVMSYAPFKDALERGYRFGILQSSRMGYNVYRRLGFEEICKLVVYKWNLEG